MALGKINTTNSTTPQQLDRKETVAKDEKMKRPLNKGIKIDTQLNYQLMALSKTFGYSSIYAYLRDLADQEVANLSDEDKTTYETLHRVIKNSKVRTRKSRVRNKQ